MVQKSTINQLLKLASNNSLSVLTFKKNQPKGYGRIIRNPKGQVEAIVEEKEANKEQKAIREVNSGIMAIKSSLLKKLLPQVKNNNAAKEYYLTDIVELAKLSQIKVKPLLLEDTDEALGENTTIELHDL